MRLLVLRYPENTGKSIKVVIHTGTIPDPGTDNIFKYKYRDQYYNILSKPYALSSLLERTIAVVLEFLFSRLLKVIVICETRKHLHIIFISSKDKRTCHASAKPSKSYK